MNQFVLVGRLVNDFEMKEDDGKKVAYNTLAVQRAFKESDGFYKTDFIPFTLNGGIAANSCEYCRKGDVVGLKGRLEGTESGLIVRPERITFLSASKVKENDNVDIDKKI